MKNALLVFFAFLMMSCTSLQVQQLPTPEENVRLFKIEELKPTAEVSNSLENPVFIENQMTLKQQSLLTVQFSAQQWRWIQTDIFGAPLARVVLTEKGWQNDGFIMPNKQAETVFSALATALYPTTPIFHFSQIQTKSNGAVYWGANKPIWFIQQKQKTFYILLNDHSYWRITAISQGDNHE
ncbi:hypothetical protein [Lonepinella sp. BR2271]|uniref:hypothetical protein n=1 Tax=Lonepinella sp. BR2271 TaxID=3434550 RepID=UPI003F6E0C06